MRILRTYDLRVYDLSSGQPVYVPCFIESVEYGSDGLIEIWGYLPESLGFHNILDAGVHVQVVSVPCGQPDLYENVDTIVADLKDGTSTKCLLLVAGDPVILNVNLQGKVTPGPEKGSNE